MINIVPVILCGGSGTRLWPRSRQQTPKQFQNIIGEHSMFQQTLMRVKGMGTPLVITNAQHEMEVSRQLAAINRTAEIVIEPVGRNTAPAIAVAAKLVASKEDSAIMVVMPSDHLIGDQSAFERALGMAIKTAKQSRLVTFGIKPDRAETGYGYIQVAQAESVAADIRQFVEKPDSETAQRFLDSGNYLWNSGMFVFRAGVMLEELQSRRPALLDQVEQAIALAETKDHVTRLPLEPFESCEDISIDYAVMEKTNLASCVTLEADWNDLGGWSSVWSESIQDKNGNAVSGDICSVETRNCLIHGSDRLIASIGIEDLVIVDTPDSLLVAHREQAHLVKDVVASLNAEQRPESLVHKEVHRPWGTFESIDQGERHQVKHITVEPGQSLSKQMHHHRAEHWIIVSGTAVVEIDGQEQLLSENESCFIPTGAVHRLTNPGKVLLRLIEVQTGSYLGEDDIVRFEDIYGRAA